MALTTTEENQLRELLRRSNATQSGKHITELPTWVGMQPSQRVITSDGRQLVTVSGSEVATMATMANVTTGNARSASALYNHLMTRDATRSEITRLTDSRINEAKSIGQAAQNTANSAQNTANSAKSIAEGIIPHVNANTSALKSAVKGYTDGLVMDFGGLPGTTGASTITFSRRFKGSPVVIINFWGDVGNPRFSLAQTGNETWGIRLSATYPGIWAVIGEPA